MHSIASMIVNRAVALVILSLIVGILVHDAIIDMIFPLLPLFLVGMMLSAGLMLSDIGKGIKPFKLTVIILLQYIASALLGLVSALLLLEDEELILGQVLHGSMPSEQTIPVWVRLANGNLALSVSVLALSTLVSPLLSPAMMYMLVGRMVEMNYVGMMVALLATVILPLLIGYAIRRKVRSVDRYDTVYQASSILSALPTVMVIGAVGYTLASDPLMLVYASTASLLHLASTLALAFYTVRVMGWRMDDGMVLIYNTSMKEFTVTLSIVSSMGLNPMVGLPAALYGMMHMITAPILARYFKKIK